VIGRNHQGALVTLVDRKSRCPLIEKVDRRTKKKVNDVVDRHLDGLPAHTLTVDNGREFASHQQ
jgi:transposase, IS30 family